MPAVLADRVDRVAARLPRAEVLLGWLLAGHVLLKLLVYPLVMEAPPYGDEQQYYDGARAFSNLLRDVVALTSPDAAELERNVVASGWFMPGVAMVMTPLFVVFPDAPDPLCRAYLGLATLLALVWAVRSVRKRLGPGWATLLVVFPGLVPSWVLMSFAAYGDLLSGLVLVVLVAHVVDLFRGLRSGEPPGWGEAVRLGLLAIAMVYLRSSTSVVLAVLGTVTLGAVLLLLRGRQRWRALAAAALAAVVFLVLLAPWSVAASRALDTRVTTTTTLPVSLGGTFGDRADLCFGPCDPDSPLWFQPLRYAREVARATGESEVDVQRQMSAYALRDLDRRDYARQAWWNIGSYYFLPANFVRYLTPPDGRGPVGFAGQVLVWVGTHALFLPVLLLMLVSMAFAQRRSLEAQVLDALGKLCLVALFVQPFVHIAGARYWTTAGPLFVLAAAGLARESYLRRRRGAPVQAALTGDDARLGRWLLLVQRALGTVFVGALVVLGVLAI